jgi:predicted deacetylase
MIPRPAQYLIRFDDLCPTLPKVRWQQFQSLVREFDIRPILAVVPDNQDPELERSPHDPGFWEEMRAMESAGSVIAAHGYQHLCSSRGASLLGLHRSSEFAGVELNTQRAWIRTGLEILRGNGLNPRLWVAPRHGFDLNTVQALRDADLQYISDGLARIPYKRDGLTWIPQQLWSPVWKSRGLWTICIHPSAARRSDVERLRFFLEQNATQCTSFDRVLKEFSVRRLDPFELVCERLALWRVQHRHRRARKCRNRV